MSFAGHVFDMIRRYKENRQVIGRHREDAKDRVKRSISSRKPYREWNVTAEDLGKIKKETEAKKQSEQRYFAWVMVIVLALAVAIFFVLIYRGSL